MVGWDFTGLHERLTKTRETGMIRHDAPGGTERIKINVNSILITLRNINALNKLAKYSSLKIELSDTIYC